LKTTTTRNTKTRCRNIYPLINRAERRQPVAVGPFIIEFSRTGSYLLGLLGGAFEFSASNSAKPDSTYMSSSELIIQG